MVAGKRLTPLVVIVGQTGTGKSALAMALAERFDGEIIAADSRTVYKGMDIGTAKPTRQDQQRIPHHCLDIVEPGEVFTAYDFKGLALRSVDDIASRGKLPFLVGGTGLYVDALLYNFSFRALPDAMVHAMLENLPLEELQHRIAVAGLPLPQNSSNARYLRRVLESGPAPDQPKMLRPNTLIIGLRIPRDELRTRIIARVEQMVSAGLIDEIRILASTYGNVEALHAPAYKAFAGYITGAYGLAVAKQAFVRNDMQLAKRQLTWFKRNKAIHWLSTEDKLAESTALLTTFLHNQGSA